MNCWKNIKSVIVFTKPRYLGVSMVQSIICFVDLTDVTLVDEETNSVATADAKRAIPGKLSQMPQTFLNFLNFLNFSQSFSAVLFQYFLKHSHLCSISLNNILIFGTEHLTLLAAGEKSCNLGRWEVWIRSICCKARSYWFCQLSLLVGKAEYSRIEHNSTIRVAEGIKSTAYLVYYIKWDWIW